MLAQGECSTGGCGCWRRISRPDPFEFGQGDELEVETLPEQAGDAFAAADGERA